MGPFQQTVPTLLSFNYKVLTTTQPSYLHNLITVQPPRSTRSSSSVTLARPSTSSSLRITDRSFQYASPRLWNQLPDFVRQSHTKLSNSASPNSYRVAFFPLVPLTYRSYHTSSLHSFTPGLKPLFSSNPSHGSLLFLLETGSNDSPDCLPILLSISVFTF